MILIFGESYNSFDFSFVILMNYMISQGFQCTFTVYFIVAVTIIHFLFFIQYFRKLS